MKGMTEGKKKVKSIIYDKISTGNLMKISPFILR